MLLVPVHFISDSVCFHSFSLRRNHADEAEARAVQSRLRELKNQLSKLEQEQSEAHESRLKSLEQALFNYMQVLKSGDSSVVDGYAALRVCSLWLGNGEDEKQVNEHMEEWLDDVPTHFFIPLMHQLVARVGDGTSPFMKTVKHLVDRAARDHPFHVFYMIYAISEPMVSERAEIIEKKHGTLVQHQSEVYRMATTSLQSLTRSRTSSLLGKQPATRSARAQVAHEQLEKLSTHSNWHRELVDQMRMLSYAYIHLANRKLPDERATGDQAKKAKRHSTFELSEREDPLLRLNTVHWRVPIPTSSPLWM